MTGLVVPVPEAAEGITLARYREDLASRLGTWQHVTVSETATAGDTNRYLLIDEFRDDEEGRDYLAGQYVYVRDGAEAGVQRRIARTGFEGPQGALVVSRPFMTTVAVGTGVELTAPLPVVTHLGLKGLNEIVNEALARVRVRARVALTSNGTTAHTLDHLPWLTREEQIDGVYDWGGRVENDDNPWRSPYRFGLRHDGPGVMLETDYLYGNASTFHLGVFLRGDQLVRSHGAWGYTEAGLVRDDDAALPPLHWVRVFGMAIALGYLARRATITMASSPEEQARSSDDYLRERRSWAHAATLVEQEFPRPSVSGGPSLVGVAE